MHVIWYTAMSMDGRIADNHHRLDFLETIGQTHASGDDFGSFLKTIDAVVIGASTLRWLVRNGHGWPHGELPTWLVSHDVSLPAAAGHGPARMRRIEGSLETAFIEIEASGHRRVWLCGGGAVAGQALALDRIDEVVVTVAPTAVGAGPALFDAEGLPRRRFELAECRCLGGGAARLRWLRARRL